MIRLNGLRAASAIWRWHGSPAALRGRLLNRARRRIASNRLNCDCRLRFRRRLARARARRAFLRLSLGALRSGVLITGGFSSGVVTGNSIDEVSPISSGMVTLGVSLDRSGLVVRIGCRCGSIGRPATLPASWRAVAADRRVGQLAQPAQFIGAPDGGQNEELPPFRMLVLRISAPRAGITVGRQCRMRTARRLERQDQDHDGEEYAAYWDDPKNRQHHTVHN